MGSFRRCVLKRHFFEIVGFFLVFRCLWCPSKFSWACYINRVKHKGCYLSSNNMTEYSDIWSIQYNRSFLLMWASWVIWSTAGAYKKGVLKRCVQHEVVTDPDVGAQDGFDIHCRLMYGLDKITAYIMWCNSLCNPAVKYYFEFIVYI